LEKYDSSLQIVREKRYIKILGEEVFLNNLKELELRGWKA